ncbi:MAG: hypothetical protein ACI8P9_001883 [Parasphingorhabdus sp.]|jgi:hypothetical protein
MKFLIASFTILLLVSCGGGESSDTGDGSVDNTDSGDNNDNNDNDPVGAKICDIEPTFIYSPIDPIFGNLVFNAAPISDGNIIFLTDDADDNLTLFSANVDGSIVSLMTEGDSYQPHGGEPSALKPQRFAVAPLSSRCGVAERVVVEANFREEDLITSNNFLARIPDIQSKGVSLVTNYPVIIDGAQVNAFSKFTLGDCGDILGRTTNASYGTLGEGNNFTKLLQEGSPIPMTNSPGNWGRIDQIVGFSAEVGVIAGIDGESTKIMGRLVGGAINTFRCFASTSSLDLDCNINGAVSLDSASSSRFAVRVSEGIQFVDITASPGDPGELIPHNQMVEGKQLNSVTRANVCESTNEIYFVGNHISNGRFQDDIFVRREGGEFESLTDLAPLAVGDEEDFVPKFIEGFSLGEFCDLAFEGRAGSNRSIWAIWRDGTLARIMKPGYEVEIAPGDVRSVTQAEFNMGTNSFDGRLVAIDRMGRVSIGARLPDQPSLVRLSYFIAEQKQDVCRVPARVNVTTDTQDMVPGDGECDTGGPSVGEQAECSLRAAIMEVNAQPGSQKIEFDLDASAVILPASPLPELTDPVTIDAPYGLTVDFSSAGNFDGLSIATPDVVIRGLSIANAGGYGINIASDFKDITQLSSVSVSNSCDFGVFTGGHLIVDDALGEVSRFSFNGGGTGCTGGGIFSTAAEEKGVGVRMSGVELNNNFGPGLLAASTVVLSRITANDNQGSGVVATPNGAAMGRDRVRIESGRSEFLRNQGDGIYIDSGNLDVKFHASINASENNGWGIYISDGKANFGSTDHLPTEQTLLNDNGQTGDYYYASIEDDLPNISLVNKLFGGGLYIYSSDDTVGASQRLQNIMIEDNDGPGVLASYPVSLTQASIAGNIGDGIAMATGDLNLTVLRTSLISSSISNNSGHGISLEGGTMESSSFATLDIDSNKGWGIFSESDVTIGNSSDAVSAEAIFMVTNNGQSAGDCRFFTIDVSGNPAVLAEPCSGGGIRVFFGDLNANNLHVHDNEGPGIEASDPGNVTVTAGQICGNAVVAEGTESLTEQLACP